MSVLNLTFEIKKLIFHISSVHSAFSHIDPEKILVSVNNVKNSNMHGTYAKIYPLRFKDGEKSTLFKRRGRLFKYSMPAVTVDEKEMLYIICFMIPRFMNRPLRDKLITIIHELYHISPDFNGDIRRFPGKNYAHGSSRDKYNKVIGDFVDEYMQMPGSAEHLHFLSVDMDELRRNYKMIVGKKLSVPKVKIEKE